MIKDFLIRYKFWLTIGLVFLLLRLPSLFEPAWYGDEGIYLVLGQGIRKGLMLYKQIHDNKPPVLYLLAAISQTVFGFRLLLFLWMIPTLVVFYRFCRDKIVFLCFLILTTIPFVEGNIANAEIFMLLPTIIGVYLVFNTKNFFSYLIAGLCLGFAFSIKIPVVVEFFFLFLWIFFENKRNFNLVKKLLYFSFGFIFPIFLFSIYFLFVGAFKEFFIAAIFQNIGYLSSWGGVKGASFLHDSLVLRFLILMIFWITVYYFKIKNKISRDFSFFLFWFGAGLFGSLLSGRPYPHYLIQTIAPFCLLIGMVFKDSKSRVISVSVLILYWIILSKYHFYFYSTFKYYANFYSYVFNLKSKDSYLSYFGDKVISNQQISKFIKNNSSPKDRIFVWGDEPYMYNLSDRLPVSRYTVSYHIVDFQGYSETMTGIKTFLPKFVIYYQMNNRPFIDLDRFLGLYYSPVKAFGNTIIYQINEINP